jgi:hypothetical protein
MSDIEKNNLVRFFEKLFNVSFLCKRILSLLFLIGILL